MPTLDYAPYDYQKLVHTYPNRFQVVVGGRRVGKSKMALMELIKHCLETPKAMGWWVSPTIAMAREVGWEEFRDYKDILDPAIENVHETLLRVTFKNGSHLYFKGADNEKGLRGRGISMLVIDEAAFVDPDIWTRALRPALSDKQGRAILISTPNGRNWFYDLAEYASREDNDWGYYHWPTIMNPLITEQELREAANLISEIDFRQEYLAEFITREGMVYDDFSHENIIPIETIMDADGNWRIALLSPSLHDGFEVFLGIDFGYANPTAICFMAVNKDTREVYQFDEIYLSRTPIDQVEAAIVSKLAQHKLDPSQVKAIYTDPAGNAEDLSSGISPVDFLRMSAFRWTVYNKKTKITPGIALVRSFIRASNGVRRYFITSNCIESIKSLNGYTYAKKTQSTETINEEPLKDGIHDHMCDAIRYFFVNEFDQNVWIQEVPEQYSYGTDHNRGGRSVQKRCPICRRVFFSKTPKNKAPFTCRECNGENLNGN